MAGERAKAYRYGAHFAGAMVSAVQLPMKEGEPPPPPATCTGVEP